MNTIEIKTDLSGEELQVLIWDLEAFCEKNLLPKPVLQQCSVIRSVCDCQIPKPIDAYHPIDKHICRDCNSTIEQTDV